MANSRANAPQDEDQIWDKLRNAAENLITVTVATVISDVKVTLKGRGELETVNAAATDVPAIVTNVDLVAGDVTTVIAPTLKDDTELRAYHEAAVERALTVLPNNLEALARVVKTLFDDS
jgi:hypothetical protein